MKFRVGDSVIVTAGKDKGKTVVVENINIYVKHIKPVQGQEGRRVENPRPLPTANVAIVNNEGKADRIGYKVNKDGSKVRIFKKTGKPVPTVETKKK
jgi:large subunit ribosomal protein L24